MSGLLKWDSHGVLMTHAQSPLGRYTVYPLKADGPWFASPHLGAVLGPFDTKDEAKAAAEEDYRRRLLELGQAIRAVEQ